MKACLCLVLGFTLAQIVNAADGRRSRREIGSREEPAPIAGMAVIESVTEAGLEAVRLRVEAPGVRPGSLQVFNRSEPLELRRTNALAVVDGQAQLKLPDNAQCVVFFDQTRVHQAKAYAGEVVFPGKLVFRPPNRPPVAGELFMRPRQEPLPWNSKQKAHVTDLVIGLRLQGEESPQKLLPPLTVQFFCRQAQVQPEKAVLEWTGATGYQQVKLSCRLREKQPTVTAHGDLGEVVQSYATRFSFWDCLPPWPFLLLTLAGGALGGVLSQIPKILQSRAAKPESSSPPAESQPWPSVLWRAVEGLGAGLLVVGLLTLGIRVGLLPPEIVDTEWGAFIVAGICGFGGTAVLHPVVKKLFPTAETMANPKA